MLRAARTPEGRRGREGEQGGEVSVREGGREGGQEGRRECEGTDPEREKGVHVHVPTELEYALDCPEKTLSGPSVGGSR